MARTGAVRAPWLEQGVASASGYSLQGWCELEMRSPMVPASRCPPRPRHAWYMHRGSPVMAAAAERCTPESLKKKCTTVFYLGWYKVHCCTLVQNLRCDGALNARFSNCNLTQIPPRRHKVCNLRVCWERSHGVGVGVGAGHCFHPAGIGCAGPHVSDMRVSKSLI